MLFSISITIFVMATEHIIRNTVTNYFNKFLLIAYGIFSTRILFKGLGEDAYGFWILLYGVFSATVLLDFGFGLAANKYAAEFLHSRDSKVLNERISTIFFSYFMIGLIILGLSILILLKKV